MSNTEIEKILISKDPYFILGVKRDFTIQELKIQFKKRAIQFHPDKNKHEKSSEVFKKISAAF